MIPPKKNRKEQREYDRHLYRERHVIECFIGKIKQHRRVFSRFEKLSKNYLGFLSFVSALVWLR
jgi:transposase